MQTAESLFALTLNECVDAIRATGTQLTTLVQGHMGCGKSSILKILKQELPNHIPCYFDCTTKDMGDLMLPKILSSDDDTPYVRFAPNEEMGFHHGKPIILMIDEFGKANQSVKNGMMRIMLERKLGTMELHPESIVFATTNLGTEGVGDLLQPHHRNRITVVRIKKPTVDEWIENFAYNAGIHTAILAWLKENGGALFQSFEDVANPDDNPYIYHPKSQRPAFVTPRSLELASHWLHAKDKLTPTTLKQALMGTIGARGGADLEAFISLYDQLPKQKEIIEDAGNAKVPESASAKVMLVDRALTHMTQEFVTPWLTYMQRLDKEAQALFVMQVRKPTYAKQAMVMTNKVFTQWCMANNYLFTADV